MESSLLKYNNKSLGRLYKNISLLIYNIIKYKNISLNLNSINYWNDRLSKYNNFWRNDNYYQILDLLPKDNEFDLLDVGCAIGDGCELINNEFPRATITGIDISDVGIRKAKEKNHNIRYLILDILRDDIDKKYDYITIIQTLEHFSNPFHIIDKCLGYTKNSIIVSTPYSPNKNGKLRTVGEHRYLFNEDTFSKYKHNVIKVTDFIKVSSNRCIIYQIFAN